MIMGDNERFIEIHKAMGNKWKEISKLMKDK
jgi:hypothetical protein